MARDGRIALHLARVGILRTRHARAARLGAILGDVDAALGDCGIEADVRMRAALVMALAKDDPVHDRANGHVLRVALGEIAERVVR